MITFYLVRHGEAENNILNILNSAPITKEYSLTREGKRVVTETAARLATVGAAAIWSSPILRAKETAEIISQATGLPITFDDRLWELGMGKYNGKTQGEMWAKYPDPQMRLSPDPQDEMEGILDVRGRLESFLHDMERQYEGKKVIVVSHGDPLEQFHGILTNEAPGCSATGWYPEKGSCTEVLWNR